MWGCVLSVCAGVSGVPVGGCVGGCVVEGTVLRVGPWGRAPAEYAGLYPA